MQLVRGLFSGGKAALICRVMRAQYYLLLNLQFQRNLLRQAIPQLLPLPAAIVQGSK